MKKLLYSIICLLNIETSLALKTEKVSQYDLLYKDSFSIKIDTSTNLYRSNKRKASIILIPNTDPNYAYFFSSTIPQENIPFMAMFLYGYKLRIPTKSIFHIKSKKQKLHYKDVKTDIDESKKQTSSYKKDESYSFTQVPIYQKSITDDLKKFSFWMDDILSSYKSNIFNISNLNDGIIRDNKLKKIIDIKARSFSITSKLYNYQNNISKVLAATENYLKTHWNTFVLKNVNMIKLQLYISIIFQIPYQEIRRSLIFEKYLKPIETYKELNDNSNKYIQWE